VSVIDDRTRVSLNLKESTIASDFSTTSTTWVDTGLELTLAGGTRLAILLLQAQVYATGASYQPSLRFYNVSDGVQVGTASVPSSVSTSGPGNQLLLLAGLAAGGKTIRVQMKVLAGTGYLIAAYTRFTAVEIG
jgi:hypothetical protein